MTIKSVFKIAGAVALGALAYNYFHGKSSIRENTVMITNMSSTSGGSGVIVSNSPGMSKVLTNAHVCRVVEKGGLVHTVNGKTNLVVNYVVSSNHDLCLISVSANLHASAVLANSAPEPGEAATISGHPRLLPQSITTGVFSGKRVIQVMVGLKKCTKADIQRDPLLCMIVGGFPIVKTYISQLVTATIMPGSSGSAVYNSSNELSGLVFAGNGRELSYAFVVPYEYIKNFLENEASRLDVNVPTYKEDERSLKEMTSFDDFCGTTKRDYCKEILPDMVYNEEMELN